MIQAIEACYDSMTEDELVEEAVSVVSDCQWTVGQIASHWTKRFAKGRGDAAFGERLGISPDSVYQRRRVWETFADVRDQYPRLKWSHFLIALTWDDAADCLTWAEDMQATVSEMRAWRRAQRGEDLSVPETDEAEEQVVAATYDGISELVQDALSGPQSSSQSPPVSLDDFEGDSIERESQSREQAPEAFTFESIARRLAMALEKCDQAFNENLIAEWSSLPTKLQEKIARAVDQLAAKMTMVE